LGVAAIVFLLAGYQNIWFCGSKLCALVTLVLLAMNLEFLGKIPWFNAQLNPYSVTNSVPTKALTEQPKEEESRNEPKLPFLSLFPWGESAADKFQRPSTINIDKIFRVGSLGKTIKQSANLAFLGRHSQALDESIF